VKFEKWQALGNDYLIFEAANLALELTPTRIRRICDPHLGPGSDGILVLSGCDDPQFVADLKIFNPDGSEAELSGNGARQALLYLRQRGWTDHNIFSIRTQAGEIRATITGTNTATVDMGRATLESKYFPDGAPGGGGSLMSDGNAWEFQHVCIGNPQCAIKADLALLDGLDLPEIGPGIEHNSLFPQRTNVSWFAELEPGVIRARIFERGVGETMSSGTGATGAAVAYVLTGADPSVRVVLDGGELTVEVGEDLHVNLTGWAVPIYAGELAANFIKELHES